VYFQFEAMEKLNESGTDYVYDVDIRDDNLWMREEWPVILVLFDAGRRRAFWLPIQWHFHPDRGHPPEKGTKPVRARVPKRQAVNRRAIAKMRDLKWQVYHRERGGVK
jgi:hypothetical protein